MRFSTLAGGGQAHSRGLDPGPVLCGPVAATRVCSQAERLTRVSE